MKKKLAPEALVTISSYSKKGYGVGNVSLNGCLRKAHVTSAIIGDQVQARMLQKKKGVFRSQIVSFIKRSQDRVEPRCSHSGICGGCSWQQLRYEKQCEEKQRIIHSLFASLATKIHPIVASPSIWAYRNKMEFSFSEDKAGKKYLGLIETGTKGLVLNLNQCELVDSYFMDILTCVRNWWETTSLRAYWPRRDDGALRTLTIRRGFAKDSWMVFLTVSGNPAYALSRKQILSFKQAILKSSKDEKHISIFLRIQSITKGRETQFFEIHLHGSDYLEETLCVNNRSFHFSVSPSSFFQPNPKMAEIMFSKALEIVSPKLSDRVLDLYCGCAAIGIVFSPFVKQVLGIESNPYAVFDARLNAEQNQTANVEIVQGDVSKVLEEHAGPFELAIIDPPRTGLTPSTIQHLKKLLPKKILYISCNPYTQLEDIKYLLDHYKILYIQPFDQFPHTPHVENMIILEKIFS